MSVESVRRNPVAWARGRSLEVESRPDLRRMLLLAVQFLVLGLNGLAGPELAVAQTSSVVRGQVRAEGTRAPLAGAVVEMRGGSAVVRSAVTDARGEYRIRDAPPGRAVLRVQHVGYSPFEIEVQVAPGRDVNIDLTLSIRPIPLQAVTVETDRTVGAVDSLAAAAPELAIVVARAIETSPGLLDIGIADAVRGIPGKEPTDPASVLYVRGAAADLKLVYLDGAPVYAPFPLGGLMEPFATGLLNRADVYLGGAPARYDGGLSYIMDLRTRGARGGGARADAGFDLLSGRLLAEAGFGSRAGIVASARGVHRLTETAGFGSDLPYGYREALVRTDVGFGDSGSLAITGFANDESVWMGLQTSRDSVIRWGNRAGSARLSGAIGRTAVEVTAAVGDYSASLPLTGSRAVVAEGGAHRTRFSVDFARNGDVQFRYGASADQQSYSATAVDQRTGATSARLEGSGRSIGMYAEAAAQIGRRLRVRGGARADHFSARSDLTFAPRLAATWLITESAAMTIAAGSYHQFLRPPDEVLLSDPAAAQLLLDGSLSVGRASHVTASLDQDLGENIRLGIEGFYKEFSNVPGGLAMAANASGVDFWVRRSAGSWTGWIGYSLAWVWSRSSDEHQVDFNGRHLLSSGVEATIRDRTRLAFRFAYGAGLPYTGVPLSTTQTFTVGGVTNVFQRGLASVNQADRGGTETAPLLYTPPKPYVRLDASVSQAWSPELGGRTVQIEPYVKVLNGLGRRDALFYFVEDGDDQARGIGALPILPVAGVTVRF